MTKPLVETLETLVSTGTVERLVEFLSALDEASRRSLRGESRRWYRQLRETSWEPWVGGRRRARVALIATETWSRLRRLDLWEQRASFPAGSPGVDAPEIRVLLDRHPKWLGDWAEWIATSPSRELRCYWWTLRELQLRGLIEEPKGEAYVLGFFERCGHDEVSILSTLDRDPGLLENPFWSLFDLHTDSTDLPRAVWLELIPKLSLAGRIDRGRVLEGCLRALSQASRLSWGRWFVKLLRGLEPSDEEIVFHGPSFLLLLESRHSQIAAFALDKVNQHLLGHLSPSCLVSSLGALVGGGSKKSALAAMKLVRQSVDQDRSLLLAASEILLRGLVHTHAEVQSLALDLIEEWKLGDSSNEDPALLRRLRESVEVVAPVHRQRLRSMVAASVDEGLALSEDSARGHDGESFDSWRRRAHRLDSDLRRQAGLDGALEALGSNGLPSPLPPISGDGQWIGPPRLQEEARLKPIENVEQLTRLAMTLLTVQESGQQDADDLYRFLAGLNRLHSRRGEDFDRRTAPLVHLIEEEREGEPALSRASYFEQLLMLAVMVWLRPPKGKLFLEQLAVDLQPPDSEEGGGFEQYFGCLIRELCEGMLAGEASPLIGLPNHSEGWLEAGVLVKRIKTKLLQEPPPKPWDCVFGLLRLAPEGRSAARQALGPPLLVPEPWTEVVEASRFALGASDVAVGPSEPLWISAARSRCGIRLDLEVPAVQVVHPRAAPGSACGTKLDCRLEVWDRGWAAIQTQVVTQWAPPFEGDKPAPLPTSWFLFEPAGFSNWARTAWPGVQDPLMIRLAREILMFPTGTTFFGCRGHFDVLLRREEPLTAAGGLLLGVALQSSIGDLVLWAREVLEDGMEDGRVGGAEVGRWWAPLTKLSTLRPARWAKTLADLADVSPLHGRRVHELLEELFAGFEPEASHLRRVGPLLELFHGLAMNHGLRVQSQPCREHLTAVRGKGKGARFAKELLGIQDEGSDGDLHEAQYRLLSACLARAEAWQERRDVALGPGHGAEESR
ncbi:MAG: hypothetical protein K0U98_08640 [Deltaproteobacteria bacterium]|nr:hypothetical protein [Deltaproteobacteria bacterium]